MFRLGKRYKIKTFITPRINMSSTPKNLRKSKVDFSL